MIDLAITDHALLRWMERVHGVNVEEWRRIMRSEVEASLEAYDGRSRLDSPSFIVSPGNRITAVLAIGQRKSLKEPGKVIPRVA